MDATKADTPFDIRDGRAMVSLGPLSPRRFCTYACEFCYVHSDFSKYPHWSPKQIQEHLIERRELFDIVYVSGDTDSLSPPRTDTGIELLEALETLGCDLLFTTRAPLGNQHIEQLGRLGERMRQSGRLLIGCISITRLRAAPHIEPKPIPSPEARMEVLKGLHASGIVTMLAMRPFLPIVPVSEYLEIVSRCHECADVVLGEVWYADRAGTLELRVLGNPASPSVQFTEHEMDFDSNGQVWKVWEALEVEAAVRRHCSDLNVPFFMRSRPAVEYVRSRRR